MYRAVALTLCVSLFGLARPAYAIQPPFSWPDSYMVTIENSSKTKSGFTFFNAFRRDGLKFRNQFSRPDSSVEIEIFRLDEHKRLTITSDGTISETQLPAKWPISNIFPKSQKWESLGSDYVYGQKALKYKVYRDSGSPKPPAMPPYVTVWLSADKNIPLRMEDGDTVLSFMNYSAGPQDPQFFEVVGK